MVWRDAISMAARAHDGQRRKDEAATPYIAHPARVVVTIAADFGVTDGEILAAAALHDVLEDTNRDRDDIADRFGERIAGIVATLSKDTRLPEQDREEAYFAQLEEGPWEARLIKLADVLDNVLDSRGTVLQEKAIKAARRTLNLANGDDRLSRASDTVAAALNDVGT